MNIFLSWSETRRNSDKYLDPQRVATGLYNTFAPLFANAPQPRICKTDFATMIFLEIPVRGWKPAFFQENAETWALALEYPLNVRTVLRATGTRFHDDNVLLALSRGLENHPTSLLRELVPPFSLLWSHKGSGRIFFQNDGLGQSQVFEYRDSHVWALTNKICALKALNASLELDPEQWATRFTLGWFPLNMTGYKNTDFLEPATQIRVDSTGVCKTSHDVLSSWVHPAPMSKRSCLELARSSLLNLTQETMRHWEQPSVGLSGGWDSRAVVASLLAARAKFKLRVRGNPERYDVMIASKLADIAGLKIRIKTASGLPPDDPVACKRSISRALLWQAGFMPTLKHKTFLVRKEHLDGGVVNVMGQHGGLGKADFAVKIRAAQFKPQQYETLLVETLMKGMPPFLRKEFHDRIREIVLQSYHQANRYSLTPLAHLHFFFLYEYTRRWSSATLSSQTGLVFAPYLNPDFIRACYAYPEEELPSKPFHRHITATHTPEWASVPYTDEVTESDLKSGRIRPVKVTLRKSDAAPDWQGRSHHKKYNYSRYWREVGEPIIQEMFTQGGFWTTIFDPDLAKSSWEETPGKVAPDELVTAYLLPIVLQNPL